jgi:nicotinamidase-related amidase
MPITAINPSVALVVIDIQKGIVGRPTVHPMAGVLENVFALVEAFRKTPKPVVLVRVGFAPGSPEALKPRADVAPMTGEFPPEFMEYVDELAPDPARDILVTKRQWGAFYGTDLELQLRRRGVTDIVLCGVATSIGVESTARDAYERGFNLSFAVDAMTDMNLDAHDRALERIFPRIGELGTTHDIIAKL